MMIVDLNAFVDLNSVCHFTFRPSTDGIAAAGQRLDSWTSDVKPLSSIACSSHLFAFALQKRQPTGY